MINYTREQRSKLAQAEEKRRHRKVELSRYYAGRYQDELQATWAQYHKTEIIPFEKNASEAEGGRRV
jgi:hypothetical protein